MRTEVGDSITYTSKEVNFREIAEAETYDETSLISEQEQILLAAQIEIDRLSNLSIEDPLIAAENDAQGRLKQCSNALSDNDIYKRFISETNTRISNIASCSLSDGNVFDTLWGTSLTDEDLISFDFSCGSSEATGVTSFSFLFLSFFVSFSLLSSIASLSTNSIIAKGALSPGR